MDIKYMSSSGKEYNLLGEKMRATSGNFHSYTWKTKLKERTNGSDVEGFEKESKSYKLILTFRGDLEERKKLLDEIRECFEGDVVKKTPGIFCFGEYSIEGFVVSSVTTVSEIKNCWSQNEIEIFCPYSFWIKKVKTSFEKYSGNGSDQFLNYPYNFPYNYTSMQKGFSKLKNEHYAPAHFLMTIYGPAVNPMIIIGGHTYVVNTTIRENEYLEIDSGSRTAIRTLVDGTKVSEFNNRGQRIFERIPPGELTVNWSGEFGFDIVLYYERSEPKWIQK